MVKSNEKSNSDQFYVPRCEVFIRIQTVYYRSFIMINRIQLKKLKHIWIPKKKKKPQKLPLFITRIKHCHYNIVNVIDESFFT